ncbi:MAG: ATPase, T2SS/T4P/T4SS family [Patescibacteria group bacterium]|nr:ATPase, T2SS/T4P/T4SS family [Patescibacteria group bacterium]
MRDPETIKMAITLAETGHLVISTLHTNDSVQTIDRMVDVFPGNMQTQIRMQLSQSLA